MIVTLLRVSPGRTSFLYWSIMNQDRVGIACCAWQVYVRVRRIVDYISRPKNIPSVFQNQNIVCSNKSITL
jgi:hypothetical protein